MVKIIDYKENTGKYNMQFDFELLESAISTAQKEPVFRLYGWNPPCVSLGRNQKNDNINLKYLKQNNIDIVKRITGGRALFHDDEITYSFVCPVSLLNNGESVINSYKEISSILIEALKMSGINLLYGTKASKGALNDYCMLLSTGADLCYEGRKLIGSAQARKQGYILQHGSILFSYKKEVLEKIFNETINTDCLIGISEINKEITKQDIINCLKKSVINIF